MEKQSSILNTIREHATANPDAICFLDESGFYTYGELISRSDALAAELTYQISDTNSDSEHAPVLCFGGLCFDMVVSFMACVRSGHPYVPVDGATPAARAAAIRDISGCCAIIAAEPWIVDSEKIAIIEACAAVATKPRDTSPVSLVAPVSDDDIFYIIFTSGTTGTPKGVQISHNNLTDFTDWILRDFGIRPGMRFLLQAAFSFDLSVMSLWPALLSGGALVTISKAATQDFKRLFSELPELDLNVWVSTPSFADLCLSDPAFNANLSPHISHFLFCGDELLCRTAEKLIERFPAAKIFNTYGPTEATVAVTQVEITNEIIQTHERLPVGSAKPGTVVAIAVETDESIDGNTLAPIDLPDGTIGEIIIAGSQVSKGYLNDPEKTAAVFLSYDGMPAYRTGDAGMIEDGQLYFKGRLDFQVKFHGYRIELEGIEQHLLKNPMIANAVVVPEYKDYKVRRLVAYVVTAQQKNDAEPVPEYKQTKYIKEALGESIQQYMIPQKFVYVNKLPLTKNGKLDRKRITDEVNKGEVN